MPSQGEDKYQQYYRSETANDDAAGTDILTLQLESEGQVSKARIFGPDEQDFHIEVRDYNTDNGQTVPGSEETKIQFAGDSQYVVGHFDDPLFEFGAVKELAVVADTELSAQDYGINVRVDELTG